MSKLYVKKSKFSVKTDWWECQLLFLDVLCFLFNSSKSSREMQNQKDFLLQRFCWPEACWRIENSLEKHLCVKNVRLGKPSLPPFSSPLFLSTFALHKSFPVLKIHTPRLGSPPSHTDTSVRPFFHFPPYTTRVFNNRLSVMTKWLFKI